MKDDLIDTMWITRIKDNIFPDVNIKQHVSKHEGRHELVKFNVMKMDEALLHLKVERSNRLITVGGNDDDFGTEYQKII